MNTEELVRTIAAEVLRQLRADTAKPCVRVLAERAADTAARVRDWLDQDVDMIFLGEDAESRAPQHHILPRLSCSDMAELSLGRASTPTTLEALDLLLAGTPVEVLEFAYRAHANTAPSALYALYQTHEKTLAAFGLRQLVRKGPDTLALHKNLVTEKDVVEAAGQGATTLRLPVTATVTPLALDAATNLHVAIRKG